MGAAGDRTPPVDRVAEIRSEVEAARARIAGTLDALRYKADVPARLGDSLGDAAATFTAHVLDRLTSARSDEATPGHPDTKPASSDTDLWREAEEEPADL